MAKQWTGGGRFVLPLPLNHLIIHKGLKSCSSPAQRTEAGSKQFRDVLSVCSNCHGQKM